MKAVDQLLAGNGIQFMQLGIAGMYSSPVGIIQIDETPTTAKSNFSEVCD